MGLIQGGPPEWIWERTPNVLKWDVVRSDVSNAHPLFELRVQCGLEIMRLHFITVDEMKELRCVIDESLNGQQPEQKQGNMPEIPEADRPPQGKEGVVSDPDLAGQRLLLQ